MLYLSENFTIEEIKNLLEAEWPELKIYSITILNNGWDNIAFDINDEYIFRFPKDSERRFDIELKLLDILRGKTTIPIPTIEFLGKEMRYMGYKKLQGSDLTMELYHSMTPEQKDKLASDYVQFIFDIHNALSIEQAKALGVQEEDPLGYIRIIEPILSKIQNSEIRDFAIDTVHEYATTVHDNLIVSFIYGDLHTENIAFDPVKRQLNGIFDFGDACIGDIHFEFAPIYKFNRQLLESVVHKYEALTNVRLSLRKIVLRCRMNELSDLAEFINKPESTVYINAMIRMKEWMNEKDIYKAT